MHRRRPGNEKAPGQPDHGPQSSPSPPPSALSNPGNGLTAIRHLMDHSGDGYFEVDLKGSFTFANEAAGHFTGRTREEMLGLNYRAFMTPEQAERNFKLYIEVYRTGQPSPLIEYEIIRKDGSVAINETTVALMRDAEGAPIGFCGMVRDLTEKRRVERVLAESEEKHRNILANMEEGYYETDLAGVFTAFNAATCQSLGRDSQELQGMNFRECMDAETAQRVFELFNEVYRTGQPAHIFECKLIRKDGAMRTHEISVSLLKNASGEPVGFFGISRDRTEQLRMERDLRESEESYRRVLELAPDAIAIHDARTLKYIQVNAAFCQHTGYALEAIIGRTPQEIKLFADPEDQWKIQAMLARERKIDGLEVTFQDKAGNRFQDLLSARMIRFKGKACALFVATVITPLKQAQEAVRESEKRYRQILDATPDTICLATLPEGRYLAANRAFYQRCGYTPEETIGRTSKELSIYADPKDHDRFVNALRQNGQVEAMEIPVRYKDGTLSIHLWSARIIQQEGQACLLVAAKPIDDLKAAQQAVIESEESYRRIMELAPDMIVITRVADSRIVAVNQTFCTRTGFSREEAVGHTPLELGLYTNSENRRQWMEMLRRDGKVQALELQFRTRDGALQDDLFSAQFVRFKGEDCLLAVITSITSLKQIQRALSESEESYRNIIESSPNAISVIRRRDFRHVEVNKAFCGHTGFRRAEVIGRSVGELNIYAEPSELAEVSKTLDEHGRVEGMEIRFRMKDGQIREALLFISPIRYKEEACLLSTSVDLTVVKEAQKELERYRQNLEQMVADRTRELEAAQTELVKRERLAVLGQLTATVSHELRNPLGVIRSSNFYLQRKAKDKDEKTLKHFRRIDEQVALCDTIVADLLEYTRGRRANLVRQALGSWLPQVIEQMQESEGIAIQLRLSADLPPWAHDREKMRRVMINALDNAIQAVRAQEKALGDDGRNYRPDIVIEAGQQEDAVILRITDNGIGMDADTCRRAFEPLFTTRARGTGIGLANVKKIVEEHEGHIELESRPGQGTQMKIVLPCDKAPCKA